MQNIVEFSNNLIEQISFLNDFSQKDWRTLYEVREVIIPWGNQLGKIFNDGLTADKNTAKILEKVDRTDHKQAFLVWYETLASGEPGETFWPETCLIGLYHAAAGIDNRYVIAMTNRLEMHFHKLCRNNFSDEQANSVYWAYKKITSIALALMIDSYHFANISGMKDVGISEALFARIRNLSIRKMIEEARQVLPLIEWNDSLSVQIESIDEQHKKLVTLLNALHGSGKGEQNEAILKNILNELVEYTVYHFKYEEDLFSKYDYPEKKNHMAAHKALVEQVGRFNEDFQAGRSKLSGDLFKFLRSWLNGHIRGTDKLYSTFLRDHGVK